jgi:hypothetical protein
MLVMWMELQQAVAQFARKRKVRFQDVDPWDCSDERVHDAWERLTNPENLSDLQKWGEAEEAIRQPGPWTCEAIKQSHVRGQGT